MSSHPNALPIPPAVADDPDAHEVMRFWKADGDSYVAHAASSGDPEAWGFLIFTIAEVVATRNERDGTHTRQETFDGMKRIFDWGVEDRRRKRLSS